MKNAAFVITSYRISSCLDLLLYSQGDDDD